ncbi:hypothetical protein U3516DRAFT_671273 [Neocallimastix sp. 'constans']
MEDPELLKKKKKLKIIEKKNKINNNNNNNENNQYDILQEDFYERKTEQWDQLIDIVFSSIFDPVNYKCNKKVILIPNDIDEENQEEFKSIGLEIVDIYEENETENTHIVTYYSFAIHNFNNYFSFYAMV